MVQTYQGHYRYNQIRAQRVAARRRAKRRLRRILLLVCMFAAGSILWFIYYITRGGEGLQVSGQSGPASLFLSGQQGADDAEETQQALLDLEGMLGEHPEAEAILQDPQAYPGRLIQLAARNAEAIPFVLGYPAQPQNPPVPDLTGDLAQGRFPALYQWDARWGYEAYAGGLIGLDGCGPVCLSAVALHLTRNTDYHPAAVAAYAQNAGYAVPGTGTAWDLMTEGAAHFGMSSTELPLDEATIRQSLAGGQPIICSVRPGDFTTSGHFIVLTGLANDGQIRVHDPNSAQNSGTTYSYDRLAPQIKNLWAFSFTAFVQML